MSNNSNLACYPDKLKSRGFNKVWSFPLTRVGHKVFDSNKAQVFDFCGDWKRKNEWQIDDESKDRLIDVINGVRVVENNQLLTFKKGNVFMTLKGVTKKLLVMKGSRRMTYEAGLNMSKDEVLDVYNEFCQFVVDLVNIDYSVN